MKTQATPRKTKRQLTRMLADLHKVPQRMIRIDARIDNSDTGCCDSLVYWIGLTSWACWIEEDTGCPWMRRCTGDMRQLAAA